MSARHNTGRVALLLASALALAGCERLPVESKQQGYRGTGMVQIDNPRIKAAQAAARPPIPPDTPPIPAADGPRARDVYQNVKVLGDLPVAEFTRHMAAITAWVSPNEGCNYCHVAENLALDTKYQKVVARRMIAMTQRLNAGWGKHVGQTGVTCYTCHRGQHEPAYSWTKVPPAPRSGPGSLIGNDFAQNKAVPSIGLTSLPYEPYSALLEGAQSIRVAGAQALPVSTHKVSIQDTERTYALMVHFSEALGVNCTYCHNTHSFTSWEVPARVTAWHGIRMVREINTEYINPLTPVFPKDHLGPLGDPSKVFCATCHQGQNKPLGGHAMAANYAGLVAPAAPPAPPLPPPVAEATRSVLYFGVGSPALDATQAQGLARLLDTLAARPRAVAIVSGYHSASGTLAQNQELAKQRAFAVRDALKAGGIAEARIRLEKPQQTEANLAGEDPAARRVEVTVQ
jgi:photosynthetic reaction center cytochrome c subunit